MSLVLSPIQVSQKQTMYNLHGYNHYISQLSQLAKEDFFRKVDFYINVFSGLCSIDLVESLNDFQDRMSDFSTVPQQIALHHLVDINSTQLLQEVN
jgi:hypothetical protein